MGSALWAGISGLNASSKELDVIANNLANVNTIGFKSGTTYFADVLSQSISGGSSGTMQVGRGVSVSEVQTQFSAGSFETTGNSTDVAIDGDGFFMVNDNSGATFYTRAGAFRLNADGILVDTNGNRVQGKTIDAATGDPIGALASISLQGAKSNPQKTSIFAIDANLNSETATGGQYNTTQTVYDTLGKQHTLNTTFTRTDHANGGYWGIESFLDSNEAISLSAKGFIFDGNGVMTGMYDVTNSAVTAAQNIVSGVATTDAAPAITTASLVGGGAGFTSIVTDNITLTRGANAATWTADAATLVKYPHMVITANASTVTINADSTDAIASDMTLSLAGTWEQNDTAAFSITKGPTAISAPASETEANPPTAAASLGGTGTGALLTTAIPMVLTRGATAAPADWGIDAATMTAYPDMIITAADATSVTIDVKHDGINDGVDVITLALTGTWAQNDTATVGINAGSVAAAVTVTEAAPATAVSSLVGGGTGFTSVGTYPITLTRGANATDPWVADAATLIRYPNMHITADASTVTIDANNDGTDDMTLALSGTWHQNDTATFSITKGVTAAGAATATAVNGTPTAVAAFDHPENVTTTSSIVLTRGATAANWTITPNTDYPLAQVVSADATTVNIDLNGDNVTDAHLTLTGTWADSDTATFSLTHAAADATSTAEVTLDRPGMVYQTGTLSLTRGATSWTISNKGGYANATVTSSGLTGPVTISLDGTGTTDVTLTLGTGAAAWTAGDIATFTLTNTAEALNDITVTFENPLPGTVTATNPTGATIGTDGVLNWNLTGDGSLSLSQYSGSSVIRALTADGYASGSLKTLSIASDGKISGFFTNGQTSDLAQLMIAQFSNPWGLKKMGSNLFGKTVASGEAIQNYPGQSGMGTLTPNTLEMSNTDIATEFIKMITAQKAYQASARVITTEDTIMQELMNLKR